MESQLDKAQRFYTLVLTELRHAEECSFYYLDDTNKLECTCGFQQAKSGLCRLISVLGEQLIKGEL